MEKCWKCEEKVKGKEKICEKCYSLLRCPLCDLTLYIRNEGLVCKNHKCKLYFKLGKGWAYIGYKNDKKKLRYFKNEYDFDIDLFENKKKWLQLKSKILYEKDCKCEICESRIEIEVHHILSRSKYPELTFDKENLMVVCKPCHLKLHENDKYKWSKK